MGMVVMQAWKHMPALQINHPRYRTAQGKDFAVRADCQKLSVFDGNRCGSRIRPIKGCDPAIVENDVWNGIAHKRISYNHAVSFLIWFLPGSCPSTCSVACVFAQAVVKAVPSKICLPTGISCSPINMPSKPSNATSGGAGERTLSKL